MKWLFLVGIIIILFCLVIFIQPAPFHKQTIRRHFANFPRCAPFRFTSSSWAPHPALTFALQMFAHHWCRIDPQHHRAQISIMSDVQIYPCARTLCSCPATLSSANAICAALWDVSHVGVFCFLGAKINLNPDTCGQNTQKGRHAVFAFWRGFGFFCTSRSRCCRASERASRRET